MPQRSEGTLLLRAMMPTDIASVLEIIAQYDEDDAQEASETYDESLFGQYCLLDQRQVIGVVGAKPIPDTDRAFGMSWTYIDRENRRSGKGAKMLQWMIEMLREQDARKVFVHSSDYIDPDLGDVYREVRDAYIQAGFVQELKQPGYYADDEALIVYGMRLQERGEISVVLNNGGIRLTDVDEIPETDGAYWLAWELVDEGAGTKPQDFQKVFDQVRQWGGRAIYMAFPSDVSVAANLVTAARFRSSGRLMDYYEDGVDEAHYRIDL